MDGKLIEAIWSIPWSEFRENFKRHFSYILPEYQKALLGRASLLDYESLKSAMIKLGIDENLLDTSIKIRDAVMAISSRISKEEEGEI